MELLEFNYDCDDATQTHALTPPLKWAGGKRWLVPELKKLFNKHSEHRLVEPFVGGMAVSLGLQPKRALLNDLNPHLINFYEQLKNGLRITIQMSNDREYYDYARNRFNSLLLELNPDSCEQAQLFYYLNRTAFNGLCRFNSKGQFNVPFGKYKKIRYPVDFIKYQNQLTNWGFSCCDFYNLSINEDDILYIDPPYDVEFTKYSKQDFNWNDQQRLVEWLSCIKNPIVASNQATDRIVDLYKKAGFIVQKIYAPRRIACNGDRTPALEILATKNI